MPPTRKRADAPLHRALLLDAAGRGSAVLAPAPRRLARLIQPLLQQALAAGVCRADLTARNVLPASSMPGSGLHAAPSAAGAPA